MRDHCHCLDLLYFGKTTHVASWNNTVLREMQNITQFSGNPQSLSTQFSKLSFVSSCLECAASCWCKSATLSPLPTNPPFLLCTLKTQGVYFWVLCNKETNLLFQSTPAGYYELVIHNLCWFNKSSLVYDLLRFVRLICRILWIVATLRWIRVTVFC